MISLIVAKAKNDVIGYENKMPWHIPAELKYFKEVTTNHTIIMGKNTLLSIGKALPNRRNIVLTTNPAFCFANVEVFHKIEDLQSLIESEEEVFVIGGRSLYEQFLPIATKLYITDIDEEFKGDTYFPTVPWEEFKLISEVQGLKDSKNNYDYFLKIYNRK